MTKTLLFKSAEALGLSKSLFDNFRLILRLFQLFAEKGQIPKLEECHGSGDCKLILVSAPLQVLPSSSDAPQNKPRRQNLWVICRDQRDA